MEPNVSNDNPIPELKFLIATDVHLGHAQNHHELGNDSYRAFQQVLSIAKHEDVDFLLLGGDLFDEVNPTQKCIFKCLNLLKDNIFGNRQLTIGVKGIQPNFSNQNLNISLPIFTIHGNHDYPSNDFGKISVCDLLNASNYVNYFGKHLNLTDQGQKKIVIKPVIFQKNQLKTRLAIYGLGYIKDLKLHKMFQDKCVIFEEPEKKQETVCLFILHQNRYKGKIGGVGASYQNCIHPEQLPKWMNLVIWCHEHEAIYKIENLADITIFQPGSTVITSYIEAQSWRKQCGLITIRPNKQFEIKSIPLEKSYRPMFNKTYVLQEICQKYSNEKVNFDQFFDKEIENIFEQNSALLIDRKPIIRIKIDYTGHQIIRLIKIEQKYRQLVANSNKIFQYFQKKQPKKGFSLEDNEVLDMIKNNKIPKNITRQKQITQEIMEIFGEQLSKAKIHFFDIPQLKDTITDLASKEGRANMNDLKIMYAKQIENNCGQNCKSINHFQQANDRQFKRIHQKLLKNANANLNGKNEDIPLDDLKADISRLKMSYQKKEKEVQEIFGAVHQKHTGTESQIPATSKSTNKTTGKGRSSILHKHKNLESESQKQPSMKISHSSDEQEDCCQRAQREDYRQNDTRMKFEKAHKMVENTNKQIKNKKNVRFKNQ